MSRLFARFGFVRSLASALIVVSGAQAALAGSIEYDTPAGSKAGEDSGSVKASAVFTLQNNHVIITLSNLFQNPTSDLQLISSLSFNISDASASGNLIAQNSGSLSYIAKGGSYTAGVSDPLTSWTASEKGTSINLTTLGAGKPSELIIGPDSLGLFDPTLGGLYSKANSSIIQHDPSVLGSATFDLTIAGVTASSTLSNVQFHFGTDDSEGFVIGQIYNGSNGSGGSASPANSPSPVPEPSSFALLGLGAVGLIISAVFRKPSNHAAPLKS